jgi:hypothetical protein
MTTLSKTRDLAHSLLTYESIAGNPSEPLESATLRVYEKLRQTSDSILAIDDDSDIC